MSKWSKWQEISSIKDFTKEIGKSPGVYEIGLSKSLGQPKPINRLLGSDEDGLLAIGESKYLATRIKQFHKASQGEEHKHLAGDRLFLSRVLGYADWKTFNEGCGFQFRTMNISTKDEAQIEEGKLLGKYFKKYGELPPLNNNMPHKCWDEVINDLRTIITKI